MKQLIYAGVKMSTWQSVSYGLLIAFACGPGAFTYGIILRVLGREGYSKFVAGGLLAVLIVSF